MAYLDGLLYITTSFKAGGNIPFLKENILGKIMGSHHQSEEAGIYVQIVPIDGIIFYSKFPYALHNQTSPVIQTRPLGHYLNLSFLIRESKQTYLDA